MAASRLSRAWSGLRSRAQSVTRYIVRRTPHVLCDLTGFGGAGLVSYGAWLIYEPAGFLVGGVLLIVAALFLGRRLEADKA